MRNDQPDLSATPTLLTIANEKRSIEEWAADYGIPCSLIQSRLRRGWSAERAVTEPMVVRRGEKLPADAMLEKPPAQRPIVSTPLLSLSRGRPERIIRARRHQPRFGKPTRSFTLHGETRSVTEWAERLGISRPALFNRIASGWPLERALTESIGTRAQKHRASLKRNRDAKG